MKDLLENLKKRLADEETIRYLKFMVIPLVVIILIIVIVVADRPQGEDLRYQWSCRGIRRQRFTGGTERRRPSYGGRSKILSEL